MHTCNGKISCNDVEKPDNHHHDHHHDHDGEQCGE